KGDGIADDTAAIQKAMDKGVPIFFPPGKYKITQEIVLKNGSKIIGSGSWGAAGGVPDKNHDTWLFYDGPLTKNSVVRASKAAVGIEPLDPATRDLRVAGITNVLIDGNDKAAYCLYMVRAGIGSEFRYISLKNCNEHGLWASDLWVMTLSDIRAVNCRRNGITIGADTFNWKHTAINAVTMINLSAIHNGKTKEKTEKVNGAENYGIGLFLGRSNIVINPTSEHNGGVGIYLSPTSGPNHILGGYTEENSKNSTEKIGLWFQGNPSGGSIFNTIEDVLVRTEGIRIAGTAPAPTMPEGMLRLKNVFLATELNADWGDYQIENMSTKRMKLRGVSPKSSSKPVPGSNPSQAIGNDSTAILEISKAGIRLLRPGPVLAVKQIKKNEYELQFKTPFAGAGYSVMAIAESGLPVKIQNKTTEKFTLKLFQSSPLDLIQGNERINIAIIGN
ncbi:MAG: glycosyl hydrolase family 28-related protein, partial [Arenimonas sp.]